MPPGNTLVGDEYIGPLYASDSPTEAHPFPVSGTRNSGGLLTVPSTDEQNNITHYVAAIVILSFAVLILIRLAGLQGMIAVGRP